MAAAVLTARLTAPRLRVHHLLGAFAALSAVGHLLLLALLPHSIGWMVLLVVMSLWCLKCSWCIMRGGNIAELMLMCAAMGAAHLMMVVPMPWFSGHHGQHAGHSTYHAGIMLLLAAAEFALMFASALVLRRRLEVAQ